MVVDTIVLVVRGDSACLCADLYADKGVGAHGKLNKFKMGLVVHVMCMQLCHVCLACVHSRGWCPLTPGRWWRPCPRRTHWTCWRCE